MAGLAPVIEQKVKESGGHTRPDSIEDKAKRFGRLRAAVRQREEFFRSGDALLASDNEVEKIIDLLKESKEKIEDPETFFKLNTAERLKEMYQFGNNSYYLCFNWLHQYYEIKDRTLIATIYEKLGHEGMPVNENRFKRVEYKFDRDLNGNNIWVGENKSFSSLELIHLWVSRFLEILGNREQNGR